jgi:hypothetical protein
VVFVHCGFATNSCSFGTGIYALSLYGNLNDFKGVFLWTGGGKRAGVFEDAGPDNKGGWYPYPLFRGHFGLLLAENDISDHIRLQKMANSGTRS